MAEKKYKLGSVDGRIEYAMDFFTSRGFTQQSAAGIVGNLLAESGLNPKSEQYGGGPGRGIAQWTVDQRWQTYLKFAKNRKLDPQSLDAQLRFVVHEMPSQMGESAKTIKTMTNANEAAKVFMDLYERPGKPNWDRRVSETDRALRMSITKGAVKTDRGPIMRAESAVVQPNVDRSALNEAIEFFNSTVPSTLKNISEDALGEARQFFNNLIPQAKEPAQPKTLIERDTIGTLRMDKNGTK
jgi:hypothetical protein